MLYVLANARTEQDLYEAIDERCEDIVMRGLVEEVATFVSTCPAFGRMKSRVIDC